MLQADESVAAQRGVQQRADLVKGHHLADDVATVEHEDAKTVLELGSSEFETSWRTESKSSHSRSAIMSANELRMGSGSEYHLCLPASGWHIGGSACGHDDEDLQVGMLKAEGVRGGRKTKWMPPAKQ